MTVSIPLVILKPKREAPILGGHPWVFSGAIQRAHGKPTDGALVRVESAEGKFAGWGLFNSHSQIRVRVYSRDESVMPDDAFWQRKIQTATELRANLLGLRDGRFVFSEADGLSGLTVDRYSDTLVVQFTSLALYQRREVFLDALTAALAPKGILLRTEQGIREEEGLEICDGPVRGKPDVATTILEHELIYSANLAAGQKTGFYFDQRDNRIRSRDFAAGRDCLDACCYTGGFAMNLRKGGARSVLALDVSANALDIARETVPRNQLAGIAFEKADVFEALPRFVREGRRFGLIVLDPPKFTRSKGSEAQALHGYISLNRQAMLLLEPNGVLITCSCSGRITREMFRDLLQTAALRAGRTVRILEQRGAAADHPVDPGCPETEYLKCFILHVL